MEKAVTFRTIMNGKDRDHPSEDALERFLLRQAEEDELEVVETHIMVCDMCITRLEALEVNIEATKLALRSLQVEQEAEAREFSVSHGGVQSARKRGNFLPENLAARISGWLTLPRLSFAGASLAACALAFTFVSVPRDVSLTAYRGSETIAVTEWVPLELHLNARDLTPGPVTVEIVDGQGGKIWTGGAAVRNEQVDVKIPRLTSAGQYFVRVRSAEQGSSAELLREFSIQTKPLF